MDSNNITNPKHYQFSKPCNEVRDVINDRLNKFLKYSGGKSQILYDYMNLIKYSMRWFEKNGIEDLRKAKYCLDSMLSVLEDGKDSTNQPTECESGNVVPVADLTFKNKCLNLEKKAKEYTDLLQKNSIYWEENLGDKYKQDTPWE
jgi:hypothetical protein